VQCTGTPCIYAYYTLHIIIYIHNTRVYDVYARVWSRDYNARCVCAQPVAPLPETRVLRVETGECGRLGADVYIGSATGCGSSCGVCTVVCWQKVIAAFIYYYFILFFLIVHIFRAAALVQRVQYYIYIYTYIYELARTRGEVCAPPSDRSESQLPQSLVYAYIYI